jgi:hypothetical protein
VSATRFATRILLLGVAACARSAPPETQATTAGAELPVAARLQTDVITETELALPSVGDIDVLTAIKRLRPHFLNTRGAASARSATAVPVRTSIDGGALTPVGNLSVIRVGEIREIRYLSPVDAAQRFGLMSGAGAVIVVNHK